MKGKCKKCSHFLRANENLWHRSSTLAPAHCLITSCHFLNHCWPVVDSIRRNTLYQCIFFVTAVGNNEENVLKNFVIESVDQWKLNHRNYHIYIYMQLCARIGPEPARWYQHCVGCVPVLAHNGISAGHLPAIMGHTRKNKPADISYKISKYTIFLQMKLTHHTQYPWKIPLSASI